MSCPAGVRPSSPSDLSVVLVKYFTFIDRVNL